MHQRANIPRARALRAVSTDAEQSLWRHLRNRGLAGHKFRRQVPVGSFVVDFLCIEQQLIVELDGGQHVDQRAKDLDRTQFLESRGYRVVRFWNDDVLVKTEDVLEEILRQLQEHHPHPSPLPPAGEGMVCGEAVPDR